MGSPGVACGSLARLVVGMVCTGIRTTACEGAGNAPSTPTATSNASMRRNRCMDDLLQNVASEEPRFRCGPEADEAQPIEELASRNPPRGSEPVGQMWGCNAVSASSTNHTNPCGEMVCQYSLWLMCSAPTTARGCIMPTDVKASAGTVAVRSAKLPMP